MKWSVNQRGDTIVEVLISIAIIGSLLAATFVVMNINFKATQQAHERTEAVKLAEKQVEQIKENTEFFAASSPRSAWQNRGELLCFGTLTAEVPEAVGTHSIYGPSAVNLTDWNNNTEPLKSTADGGSYNEKCTKQGNGARYFTLFRYEDGVFTARVHWNGVNGLRSGVTVLYRKPAP
jgi:prepilin-type N-terminal cleavage/methylation domain-containing protein